MRKGLECKTGYPGKVVGMIKRGGGVTKEFIDMIKGLETIGPHLHLRTISFSRV